MKDKVAGPDGSALSEGFGFTVTAQPLEWEPHGDGDWADKYCGFYISYNPEDDAEAPYHAAWGEGAARVSGRWARRKHGASGRSTAGCGASLW